MNIILSSEMDSLTLTEVPKLFPGYCASISRGLVDLMAGLLPRKPGFTLSIGSGSGLLEAFIMKNYSDIQIQGVEVDKGVNVYLPEDCCNVVLGTWDTCDKAIESSTWLFVYPRECSLITKYLDRFSSGAVNSVVWIGPTADVPEVSKTFNSTTFKEHKSIELGVLPEFETFLVFSKT